VSLHELPNRWRQLADTLAPFTAPAAEAYRRAAAELEVEMRSADVVTLREASLIGGYTVDHLQRVVAAGTIENVGKKGAPRLRRSDVPRKPGYVLPTESGADQLSARRRIVRDALTHPQRSA
jgi:hypothetical protein